MARATSFVTSALVGSALVVLAGTTTGAVLTITHANERVTATRATASQFALVRDAVFEEAFAEAGYRRSATDDAWDRLDRALDAVAPLIAQLDKEVDGTDAATLDSLAALNAEYAAEIRLTMGSAPMSTDDPVAGPALDEMRDLLESAVDRWRSEVTEATEQQAALLRRLNVLLPLAFGLAFGILIWVFRLDLREKRRLRSESATHRKRALTDPLTGLPNRAALLATVQSALAEPEAHVALLFLDLDRFKPINDTWGHHAGDAVLRQVAERLRDALEPDDVAARFGGDEFAIFVARGTRAQVMADRILAAFTLPFVVEGQEVELSTSIGIAESAVGDRDPHDLLRCADTALYDAKHSGRPRSTAIRSAPPRSATDRAIVSPTKAGLDGATRRP